MKRVKCTFIDTYNVDYSDQYDQYLEYCKDNDITPTGDNSSDFYGFVYENVFNTRRTKARVLCSVHWDCGTANAIFAQENLILSFRRFMLA